MEDTNGETATDGHT